MIKIFLLLFVLFLHVKAFSQNKIVSLAPNLTEIVYALGLDSQLVGDTLLCDYPEAAQKVLKVGNFNNFSTEKILASGANIILATDGNSTDKLSKLESLGIRVIKVTTKNPEDIPKIIASLAKDLGVPDKGTEIANQITAALSQLKATQEDTQKSGRTFFLALQFDPFYSVSDDTWIGGLFKMSGLTNIVSNSMIKYPIISQEFLVKNQPDIFLVSLLEGKTKEESLTIQKNKLKEIFGPNVDKMRIVVVPKDVLVRPGPRIVQGIKFIESLTKDDATK